MMNYQTLPYYIALILLGAALAIGFLPKVKALMGNENPGASISLIWWGTALVVAQAAIYLWFI